MSKKLTLFLAADLSRFLFVAAWHVILKYMIWHKSMLVVLYPQNIKLWTVLNLEINYFIVDRQKKKMQNNDRWGQRYNSKTIRIF